MKLTRTGKLESTISDYIIPLITLHRKFILPESLCADTFPDSRNTGYICGNYIPAAVFCHF